MEYFKTILIASILNPWSSTRRILLFGGCYSYCIPRIWPRYIVLCLLTTFMLISLSLYESRTCKDKSSILLIFFSYCPLLCDSSEYWDSYNWSEFCSFGSVSWSLNWNLKQDPFPFSEVKEIDPSNFSTIYLAIIRPKPIPFTFIFLFSCMNPNNLKSLSWSCLAMPIPVSITFTSKNWWPVSSF